MHPLEQELQNRADPVKAKQLQRFFKTGKGEYGEGDVFLGIVVPKLREVAKARYKNLPLQEVEQLLHSKYHEARMLALIILTYRFPRSTEEEQKSIFELYLKNTSYINNWDLVDVTCPRIVGAYLQNRDRSILYKLVRSESLWERRIAVLATFAFINRQQFADALKIAKMLLSDKHDLIHKAVGWMLREVGKRNLQAEEAFLEQHAPNMPRTMLRYAIEKFGEKKRKEYLDTYTKRTIFSYLLVSFAGI